MKVTWLSATAGRARQLCRGLGARAAAFLTRAVLRVTWCALTLQMHCSWLSEMSEERPKDLKNELLACSISILRFVKILCVKLDILPESFGCWCFGVRSLSSTKIVVVEFQGLIQGHQENLLRIEKYVFVMVQYSWGIPYGGKTRFETRERTTISLKRLLNDDEQGSKGQTLLRLPYLIIFISLFNDISCCYLAKMSLIWILTSIRWMVANSCTSW